MKSNLKSKLFSSVSAVAALVAPICAVMPIAEAVPPNIHALKEGKQVLREGIPMDRETSLLRNLAREYKLDTFVTLLEETGVNDALRSRRTMTIFAPNDAAFAALPAGALERLKSPAGRSELHGLLSNHLAQGDLNAAALRSAWSLDAKQGDTLKMLAGGGLRIVQREGGLVLDAGKGGSARIVVPDAFVSGPTLHVIERVLFVP